MRESCRGAEPLRGTPEGTTKSSAGSSRAFAAACARGSRLAEPAYAKAPLARREVKQNVEKVVTRCSEAALAVGVLLHSRCERRGDHGRRHLSYLLRLESDGGSHQIAGWT